MISFVICMVDCSYSQWLDFSYIISLTIWLHFLWHRNTLNLVSLVVTPGPSSFFEPHPVSLFLCLHLISCVFLVAMSSLCGACASRTRVLLLKFCTQMYLKQSCWEVCSVLKKLTASKKGKSITWVSGWRCESTFIMGISTLCWRISSWQRDLRFRGSLSDLICAYACSIVIFDWSMFCICHICEGYAQ